MNDPPNFCDIPFESQRTAPDPRMCGAAALCMVYRSFGLPADQGEVWKQVACSRQGRRLARTQPLCKDALRRGLSALILEARDPWAALRNCAAHAVQVVLN